MEIDEVCPPPSNALLSSFFLSLSLVSTFCGEKMSKCCTHKVFSVNTTRPGVDSVSAYRLFSVKITTGGVGDNTPESKSNELKCENQCFEMPRLHCQKINNFDTPETR